MLARGGPMLLAGGFVASLAPLLVVGALLTAPGSAGGAPSAVASGDIPPTYLALYRAAAERYRLGADGWSYLAAVGKVECDHGRSTAVGCDRGEVNFAGARGPAQFLAGTWAAYGVDGDGDGDRDVYDPADAIFGMANVPFVYWSVNIWRTVHPTTNVVPSLGPGMREAFWYCMLAYVLLYVALLAARVRLESQRVALDELHFEIGAD